MIDRPVVDMKFSSISGISEYGLLFALPGNDGGLAYFTNQDSLNIYSIASNIGAISIVPDNPNERIFCVFGWGSFSDGLYEFDVTTQEFELVTYCEAFPHFVKKLSSGFYFGYGSWNMLGGLLHSNNGDNWTAIDFFNFKDVSDIEENGDGTLFVSAGYEIYIENEGSFNSFEAPLRINDIYIRNYPNNDEVYIACVEGCFSDAVYRVEYENGEITNLTFINCFFNLNRIYEYEGYLVVGCKYGEGIFLVEPEENGQIQQIGTGLGINDVYCFEFYPVNTSNFMVGTDIGVFLATNLTSASNNEITEIKYSISLSNYPNPFNPTTTINYSLKENSQVSLNIYNIKGQKVKQLVSDQLSAGQHSITWNGTDEFGKPVSGGIYFYKLKGDGYVRVQKMVLLK